MIQRFVIRKVDGKWLTEYQVNGKVKRSEHTSRVKALNSFFVHHPGIETYMVELSTTYFLLVLYH